jgi:hypothetical protein
MSRTISECRAFAPALVLFTAPFLSSCGGGSAATDAARPAISSDQAAATGQPCGIEGSGRATMLGCVPSADVQPPSSGPLWQGRFIGTVTISGAQYYGDALFTTDGAVRLYVGGPYDPTGVLQTSRSDSATQFVGSLSGSGLQASGSGVVVGQGCGAPVPARFCGASTPASISIAVNYVGKDIGRIQGEMHLATSAGDETWSLDLEDVNNYYVLPARVDSLAPQYLELIAEFAGDGDTILSLDGAGGLYFQSPSSGCVGNGRLTPHLDGSVNVYDVVLDVESCTAPKAYLNGVFEGFATTTPSSIWDYDSLLRMWLSRLDGASAPAALSLLAEPR